MVKNMNSTLKEKTSMEKTLKVFRSNLVEDDHWISIELAAQAINALAGVCRKEADRWYYDIETGEPKKLNVGERIALMHSELSEAFEGWRKNKQDDHLPHRKSVEVELADAVIRILDFAGEHELDIGGAFVEKLLYNRVREDHTVAARQRPDGKKC
jgi:NTP pyrophosphatase (non-canonical NTP hydrolase)